MQLSTLLVLAAVTCALSAPEGNSAASDVRSNVNAGAPVSASHSGRVIDAVGLLYTLDAREVRSRFQITLNDVHPVPARAARTSHDEAPPRVFAPGVISSGAHDSAPAFSPDGNTVYFGRSTPGASFILVSHRRGANWGAPVIASFSGQWLDMEPAMAPDGTYLIFASNRPAHRGAAPVDGMIDGKAKPGKGTNLWRVDRQGAGWGEPVRLPGRINTSGSIYAPSVAADGTLYFMKPSARTGRFQLFSAPRSGADYVEPAPLPFSDGSTTDVDPAVAPDQSFIVFGSGRRANADIDLYIAMREGASWSAPQYLGDVVNSRTSDAEPRLSSDGHILYFSSERLVPVPSPVPPDQSRQVASDMSGWNNGLYNIWETDLDIIRSHLSAAD